LERHFAVSLINQILGVCPSFDGCYFALMPPKGKTAGHYEVFMKIKGEDLASIDCITDFAKERKLALRKEGEFLVVYKP
jgi:hypothetical protein